MEAFSNCLLLLGDVGRMWPSGIVTKDYIRLILAIVLATVVFPH